MSVERTTEDAGVLVDEVWPRRYLERTPSLGRTPNLPDEDLAELARAAREAARKTFAPAEPAVGADVPPLT